MKILSVINWPIIICSLLLLSFSILVIFSSSPTLAFQQGIFAVVGILIYFFVSGFDYRSIRSMIIPSYVFIVILLLIVQILGVETRGAIRWIPLGIINIQPSELAKPILILILAQFWSNHSPTFKNILKSFLWVALLSLMVFRQPDLGSALTLVVIWIGMLIVTSISLKKLVILALIFLLIIPLGWLSLLDYQRQRIISFVAPEGDPLGRGYNLIQSTIAVGSGQLFGRGLGRGTQSRLQFLPEFRTDFIFASIAEELGFIGSMIILLLYLFLFVYCLKVASKAQDLFGFLIVFGVVTMLIFQTFVNIGMNVGLVPITGITLPLISYGGSSLVATLISLGLISSVARGAKKVDIKTIGE